MKFVLVVVVVVVVLWLARAGRRRLPQRPAAPGDAATKEQVVACAHCGLHLPHSEALPGRDGVYCSEAHRAAHEQAR